MERDYDFGKLENRVYNWARWSRANGAPQGRCISIESRYVAPKLTDEDAIDRSEKQSVIPIDNLDAERVESAIHAIRSRWQRRCIIAWYLGRLERGRWIRLDKVGVAKEINVRPALVEPAHAAAMDVLAYQLRLTEYLSRKAA